MKKLSRDDRIVWGLFGASVLRNVAAGAIWVFFPVYLYGLGGLWLVIGWLGATRLAEALLMREYAKIIGRLGFKKSVLLGQILWVGVMYFMNLAEISLWALVPAGIVVTFAATAYWIPYHMLFMQTAETNFGKRASFLNVFSRWAAAAGPVIGGLLTVRMGFSGVFWFAAAVMAAAAMPILLLEPESLKWDFHLKHYWEKVTGKWFRKDLLAGVGIGIEQAMYECFWPVFLLVFVGGSYLNLGIYKTIVLAVTTMIEFLVGRVIDHGGTRKLVAIGMAVMGGMWILRGSVADPIQLLGVDIMDGWMGILVFLPFSVYSYRRAMVSDKGLYLVESEAASKFGGFVAAIGVGIMYGLGIGWNGMVTLGIVGVVLMSLLPKIGAKQYLKITHSRRGGDIIG